jgi:DNA repair exonuclease SbcCD ATPase subunit
MPVRFRSYIKVLITVCLAISFCLVEADAQTRRKRRTRRAPRPAVAKPVITNPPIASPATTENATTGDVKIISTADSTTTESTQASEPKKSKPETPSEEQEMQQTITKLSNQVDRLNNKLSEMQEDDRYHLDMERLTRAEQRAEQLRSQLIDTQSKIADFEVKLEQIEYALKPENIDKATQGFGSTRPEEAREARRRQLESERSRIRMQLKILETSKSRLEIASANADAEVDLLRAKLQQRRDQMDSAPPANEPRRTRKP